MAIPARLVLSTAVRRPASSSWPECGAPPSVCGFSPPPASPLLLPAFCACVLAFGVVCVGSAGPCRRPGRFLSPPARPLAPSPSLRGSPPAVRGCGLVVAGPHWPPLFAMRLPHFLACLSPLSIVRLAASLVRAPWVTCGVTILALLASLAGTVDLLAQWFRASPALARCFPPGVVTTSAHSFRRFGRCGLFATLAPGRFAFVHASSGRAVGWLG